MDILSAHKLLLIEFSRTCNDPRNLTHIINHFNEPAPHSGNLIKRMTLLVNKGKKLILEANKETRGDIQQCSPEGN